MESTRLLALQALGSLIAWTLVAWVVVAPWARGRPVHRVLAVVMLPLAFRTLGATMLSEQVVRRPSTPGSRGTSRSVTP